MPPVIDRRTAPSGVLPRHLQLWVLIGIAIVMVGIMSLSGTRTPTRSVSTAPAAPAAIDPNRQRIEDYERRIQEQAQRLAAEQAELHVAKEALGARPGASPGAPESLAHTQTPGAYPPTSATDSGESLRQERAQRAYRSLFADNVAFSRGPQAAAPATSAPASFAASPTTSPGERTYRIPEGSIVETVLTNRLDGTFAGPVNCLVTTPVYAADRQHLLIPAGARALGDAAAVNTFGQSRLAVTFRRLVLANGGRIDLQSFHGLNQIGETGLRDEVNHHYAQIFGASLAIGAIAGLAQSSTGVGADATAFDTYRQGSAAGLAQSAAHILDRFLNVLPTVTIREGHRIKIYLANDLDLPEYRDTLPPSGVRHD